MKVLPGMPQRHPQATQFIDITAPQEELISTPKTKQNQMQSSHKAGTLKALHTMRFSHLLL